MYYYYANHQYHLYVFVVKYKNNVHNSEYKEGHNVTNYETRY